MSINFFTKRNFRRNWMGPVKENSFSISAQFSHNLSLTARRHWKKIRRSIVEIENRGSFACRQFVALSNRELRPFKYTAIRCKDRVMREIRQRKDCEITSKERIPV